MSLHGREKEKAARGSFLVKRRGEIPVGAGKRHTTQRSWTFAKGTGGLGMYETEKRQEAPAGRIRYGTVQGGSYMALENRQAVMASREIFPYTARGKCEGAPCVTRRERRRSRVPEANRWTVSSTDCCKLSD